MAVKPTPGLDVPIAGSNTTSQSWYEFFQSLVAQVKSTAAAVAGLPSIVPVTAGTGLSGGVITTTGTVALALNNATLQTNLSDPTGTTSGTGVMMGLGGVAKLTLVYSGRIKIEFMGRYNLSASGSGAVTVRFGTGTAPTNGTAQSGIGTAVGQGVTSISFNAASNVPFNVGGIITGLTPGTAYWFDLVLTANSITTSVLGVSFNAMEF